MRKLILTMSACAIYSTVAFAQSRTVSGKVTDKNGEPLIGAIVATSDDKISTLTDGDGSFVIDIPAGVSNVLVIEGSSFDSEGKNDLGVLSLSPVEKQVLDVFVVDGYRTSTKEKYNGSANLITGDKLEKIPVTDLSKGLDGAAPGVQVTSGSGEPGSGASIRIRGIGSLSSSSAPLYVVDGTPYAGDITSINSNDIESINVLKDAIATSMYGARGANGVIVITTKRGKRSDGAGTVTVDLRQGFVTLALPDYDIMKDPGEWLEKTAESYANRLYYKDSLITSWEMARQGAAGALSGFGYSDIPTLLGGYNPYNIPSDQLLDPVTLKMNPNAKLRYKDDWFKELQRLGTRQDANVSLAGGTENSRYFMSLGYVNEKGYIKLQDYERFSGRLNLSNKPTDWLELGMNVSAAYSEGNWLGTGAGLNSGNILFIARTWSPMYPFYYYDSAGNRVKDVYTGQDMWDWGAANSIGTRTAASSIGQREQVPGDHAFGKRVLNTNKDLNLNLILAPSVKIKLTDYLNFTTLANYNIDNYTNRLSETAIYGFREGVNGSADRTTSNSNVYTFRQQLNFNKTFNLDHMVDAILVHENYEYKNSYLNASRIGLPYWGATNLAGATTPENSSSYDNIHRTEGYLFSVRYDYQNLFSLEGSFRRDASSRFAPAVRWGNFYAVGGSVNLHRMDFLKDIKNLNSLKLKASYGTQGNEGVLNSAGFNNYYPWQTLFNVGTPNGTNSAYIIESLGNPNLTWEKRGQFNVGLDYAFWDNRARGELTYYRSTVNDMITNLPIPSSSGFSSIPTNALSMYNQGLEFAISVDAVKKENFLWNTTLNLTTFNNKITKMSEQQDSIKGGMTGLGLYAKGVSLYDYWMVEGAGVYSYDDLPTDATRADSNKLGMEQYMALDSATNTYYKTTDYQEAYATGRKIVGSAAPLFYGSWTNSFIFGNFDFSFMTTFSVGGKYYDQVYQELMKNNSGKMGSNYHRDINGSWSPSNPNSNIPRVEWQEDNNTAQTSSRFLIDASYLNFRNVSLGYTLPSKYTSKIHIDNLRIYGLVDNLYMFTARQGLNPQTSLIGTSQFPVPLNRTIAFGLKFNLK